MIWFDVAVAHCRPHGLHSAWAWQLTCGDEQPSRQELQCSKGEDSIQQVGDAEGLKEVVAPHGVLEHGSLQHQQQWQEQQ